MGVQTGRFRNCIICNSEMWVIPALEQTKKYCSKKCLNISNSLKTRNPFDRFIEKVTIHRDKCWYWLGGLLSPNGYGQFWDGAKNICPHVFSYKYFIGPPKNNHNWHIHHICENKQCVNPKHLKRVSVLENIRFSSPQVKKTHCPNGHLYDDVQYRHGKFRNRICTNCLRARTRKNGRRYYYA